MQRQPPSIQIDLQAKVSFLLGLAVLAIMALFTLAALVTLMTGRVAAVENSRLVNWGYALLSACGEGLALVGVVIGITILRRQRPAGWVTFAALGLNLLGIIAFAPATIAMLFNGLMGLLDHLP